MVGLQDIRRTLYYIIPSTLSGFAYGWEVGSMGMCTYFAGLQEDDPDSSQVASLPCLNSSTTWTRHHLFVKD